MGHRRGCRSSHGTALRVGSTRPITITWLSVSALGLTSTGFMRACGVVRAASACRYCARLTSVPSGVTAALLLMFCALKGATCTPRLARWRHRAVTRNDLPASLEQPMIMMGLATILTSRQYLFQSLQVSRQWLLPDPADRQPEAGNGLAVKPPRR